MDVLTLSEIPSWEWPPGAGETLRHVLSDSGADPALRLLSAEMAGSVVVMGDRMAGALVDVLLEEDAPEALRGTAAISLGPVLEELEYGLFDWEEEPISPGIEKSIRESLRRVYMDPGVPTVVRRRALEASVRSEEPWHAGAVRAAFHSGDAEWRLTSIFCMYYVGGFQEEIVASLDDEDVEIRVEAVRAAGNWGLLEAWPSLVRILRAREVDRHLLLAAIDAVVGIDPGRALEALHELVDATDDEVAEAALDALAEAEATMEWEEGGGSEGSI